MKALAATAARLLTLAAVMTAALAFWRLAADPGWAGDFFIEDGLLSRYQLWFAVAVSSQASAFIINRWITSGNRWIAGQAEPASTAERSL